MAPVLAVGRAGYFYPRSPCGERQKQNARQTQDPHFYPRSPCGERLDKDHYVDNRTGISIHALLAESDRSWTH